MGQGNPTLSSWPELIPKQHPALLPLLLELWSHSRVLSALWCCCPVLKDARWASSQLYSLSPTHGNHRLLNKLRLAIHTQCWVTAEMLYFAGHLFKANHGQIRSALGWAILHCPELLTNEWLSHLCGEARKASVEDHLCRCLQPPCSAWASPLKLKPGKILSEQRKQLFSLKPVRHVVFWEDAWQLFTNLVAFPNNWESMFTVNWH